MSGSECKSARGFAQQNRNRTKRHKRGHKKHNKESGPCFICVTNSSLLVFLARFWVKQNSPPRMRRGGCAINKNAAKPPLKGADGVVPIKKLKVVEPTTPTAPTKEPSGHQERRGSFNFR